MKPSFKITLSIIIAFAFLGTLALMIKHSPIFIGVANGQEQPKQAVKTSADINTSWQMFRGEPSLTGVSSAKIGDSLKMRWRFKTGDSVKSSAAIVDGRVYIGSDDGKVYCLELANGNKVWEFNVGKPIESSPCVVKDSVFFGSADSFIYSIDAKTGKLKWKYETGAKILGAVNWTLSPKKDKIWVLAGSYDNKLYCIDSVTGKLVWAYEADNYINGSPAVGDGKAIFGSCDELLHIVSIADGKGAGKIETDSYVAGSPAIFGKNVYAGNYGGTFLTANIESGKTLWSYIGDGSPFFSSPAVNENYVVIGSRDSQLHCLDRNNGKVLWTFQTLGKIDSSPVIVRDKIIVGSEDGNLYMVKLSDGKKIWSFEIGEAITSSPAVVDNTIIIGCDDGYVYAFGT